MTFKLIKLVLPTKKQKNSNMPKNLKRGHKLYLNKNKELKEPVAMDGTLNKVTPLSK